MKTTESTNQNHYMQCEPLLTPEQLRIAGNPMFYVGGTLNTSKTGCFRVSGLGRIGTEIYLGGPLRINPPKRKIIRSCTERNYMR